jgi:hypothetical protein
LILYETHKTTPIVDSLKNATMWQYQFLTMMSIEDINYRNSIENILTGIAKGVGIEIKHNNSSRRTSNSFREQMKQKQKRNKEKKENG